MSVNNKGERTLPFSFLFLLLETKNDRQSFLTIGRYVVLGLPTKKEIIPSVGDDLI
jgi:hypothetical protein